MDFYGLRTNTYRLWAPSCLNLVYVGIEKRHKIYLHMIGKLYLQCCHIFTSLSVLIAMGTFKSMGSTINCLLIYTRHKGSLQCLESNVLHYFIKMEHCFLRRVFRVRVRLYLR